MADRQHDAVTAYYQSHLSLFFKPQSRLSTWEFMSVKTGSTSVVLMEKIIFYYMENE